MKRKIVQVLHLNNSSPPWWRDFTWEACWHFEVGLIRTRPGAVVDDLRLGGGKMLILSGKQTTTWCPNVEPTPQCQGTSGVWQALVRELRRWRRTLSPSQSLDPQNQLRRGHWGEQLAFLWHSWWLLMLTLQFYIFTWQKATAWIAEGMAKEGGKGEAGHTQDRASGSDHREWSW